MIIHCEDCQQKLKVPDDAHAKNAKCPVCGCVQPIDGTAGSWHGESVRRPIRRMRDGAVDESFPAGSGRRESARSGRRRATDHSAEPLSLRPKRAAGPSRRPTSDAVRSGHRRRRRRRSEVDREFEDQGEWFGDGRQWVELPPGGGAPRRKRRSQRETQAHSRRGFRRAGFGLLVHGWSLVAVLALGVVLGVSLLLNNVLPALLVAKLIRLASPYAGVGLVVGEIICMGAPLPPQSKSKRLILSVGAAQAICSLCLFLQRHGAPGVGFAVVAALAGLLSFGLFVLFIRTMAEETGHVQHAIRAGQLLMVLPAAAVLAAGVVLVLLPAVGGGAMILILAAAVSCILLAYGSYARLVIQLGRDLRLA